MAIPFKRYGYTLNPLTDEIDAPQIFLVDKQLHKQGELYPVENLQITINEVNNADEISFTYYKETDGKQCSFFEKLDDLCVIQVEGYGYFECSVSKKETSSISKDITAQSLGYSELSQILASLEVNTDDDTSRNDYDNIYPTVFYRDVPISASNEEKRKLRESSLLHRILTYAPHYSIGTVDESLWNVQRTFSWSDADIITILNDIASEINCVYDIQTYLTEGKQAKRIINFYDAQYCSKCWNEAKLSDKIVSPSKYRNIVNNVCQNCHSGADVVGVGEDSGIFISTDKLSDEITIKGDKDNVKNCFKIVGGDDNITDTVQGLNMSANNRVMMFSDLQKSHMSDSLVVKLNEYNKDYDNNIADYESILKTDYDLEDVVLYLQNSKMPQIEKEITTTDGALYSVLEKIKTLYNNQFFMKCFKDYSSVSAKNSIYNMFTTFMPEGYSFMVYTDDITRTSSYQPNTTYSWFGTIKIYSTGDRDDYYTLHVTKQETYVTYVDSTNHYITSDSVKQNYVNNFTVCFKFAEDSSDNATYRKYLEHHIQYTLRTNDVSYDNEIKKNWGDYCYNRLNSMYSGYSSCLNVLYSMQNEITSGDGEDSIIEQMIGNYYSIQNDIHRQMLVLQDQIFALCSYRGDYLDDFVDENGNVTYELQYYSNIDDVFNHMISSNFRGGYDSNNIYKVNEFIGTKPIKCKKCGSTNVTVSTTGNICRNNECTGSGNDIYTYLDVMRDISDSYKAHKNITVKQMRNNYQKQFNIITYLNDDELYNELLSFIREDVYQNDNYTSVGLNNSELIEKAKELKIKAEQELSKACNIQYTITASLSSIIGQKGFTYNNIEIPDEYSKFRINNLVRVQIDDIIYNMRISSISYSFPISDKIDVTFTNVSTGAKSTMSDISEVIKKASSMATSYNYIATQAEKGEMANTQFDILKNEGLNAGLMAVKAGQNQDVVIDEHGILLRKKNIETNEYDSHQMKIINHNIVMTDDNWVHSKMAIGLGMYNSEPFYGVWADILVGNLMITKKLHVKNGDESVIIDEHGIKIENGSICIGNNNYSVEIDPSKPLLFAVKKKAENKTIMGITQDGNGYFSGEGNFSGEITATTGTIGSWEIQKDRLATKSGASIYQYKSNTNGDDAMRIINGKAIFGKYNDKVEDGFYDQDGYSDISSSGIYVGVPNKNNKINGTYLFAADTTDLTVTLGGTVETYGIVKAYNGLHLHDGDTNYAVLDVSCFSNKAIDAYVLCKNSMAITYKLQVGTKLTDGRVFEDEHELFVNGSSYVTGTSYTNSGTTVTSDRNKKNSISVPSDSYIDLFDSIEFKKYKYNDGTSDRFHLGVIAQDVEEAMEKTGISSQDFGGLVIDEQGDYFVRYDEINVLTALKVKQLEKKVSNLEKKISDLEEKLNKLTIN